MKTAVKILICLWLVFMIIIVIANVSGGSTKLEMVQHGEMEKSYSFDAVIIRDETLIENESNGVLESMVEENEMVRRNKHVASVYETKVDASVKEKLTNLNIRIEEISKLKEEAGSVVSAGFIIEGAIDEKVNELSLAISEHNVKKVLSIKNEISLLNDKKTVWEQGGEYTDKILEDLKKEKEEYEKKLGNSKQDLFSPASGIYSTNIDGYENILSSACIGTMTPDDFYSIKNMKKTPKDSHCKIIDNFEWSVAFVATEKEISKVKTGSSVYIRNESSPKDMIATITYISPPQKGKFLVIATSDVSCDWAMKDRFIKIDLIKNKYVGLKVPVKALRVVNNNTGVYVVVDGIVKYKKVRVLYKDSGYAIVEENNVSRGGLLLYDEVIVSSSQKLKDGDKLS